MTLFAFDSETYPIRPGRQAPKVVCVQSCAEGLQAREEGLDSLERALAGNSLIVGHNTAYDALCSIATRPRLLPLWFQAYEQDRVTCTHEREKLIRIAEGSLDQYPKNDLLTCVKRYHLENDYAEGDKDSPDAWRTRYHELDGLSVDRYPADARRYALADLIVERLYVAQGSRPGAKAWLQDEYRTARAAFWLALTTAHGMRVDLPSVVLLQARVEAEHENLRRLLSNGEPAALEAFCAWWNLAHPDAPEPMTAEWVRVPFHGGVVRPVGSKDTKLAARRMAEVCRDLGLPIPRTETGKTKEMEGVILSDAEYVSLEADATATTLDPILIAYSRFTSIGTLRSRAARLRLAAESGLPIQPRFDALKKTGRTSASTGKTEPGRAFTSFGDQTQNLMRLPGLRECYVARPGCVILSSDWRAAELGTLGQTCVDLGLDSNLARVLRSGQDVHLWFAAKMKGWTYEYATACLAGEHGDALKKEAKDARQLAKAYMFGLPGGLGIDKFRAFAAKQYHVRLSDSEAREKKAFWLETFPEMVFYFRHISDIIDTKRPLIHFRSNRYRGDLRFTAAANSYFQGRNADMLKDAGFRLAREFYCNGLPGRLWNESHDEFLCEIPERCAPEVAREVVAIMEATARDWCPACPPAAEPALQRVWRKGAEPVYRDGRLIPWEDRDLSEKTIEKVKKEVARGESVRYTSWLFGIMPERVESLCR